MPIAPPPKNTHLSSLGGLGGEEGGRGQAGTNHTRSQAGLGISLRLQLVLRWAGDVVEHPPDGDGRGEEDEGRAAISIGELGNLLQKTERTEGKQWKLAKSRQEWRTKAQAKSGA